jgi:eukaryotic-like serine/threonine-protein kinase
MTGTPADDDDVDDDDTANDYYLYDMLGNVWEWVNDWYLSEYYEFSPVNDPPGSEAGEFKVLRGGSWVNDPDAHMTASDRFLQIPESKYKYVGFRCIKQ